MQHSTTMRSPNLLRLMTRVIRVSQLSVELQVVLVTIYRLTQLAMHPAHFMYTNRFMMLMASLSKVFMSTGTRMVNSVSSTNTEQAAQMQNCWQGFLPTSDIKTSISALTED